MIEKLKAAMLGKTIEKIELSSYQAENDILIVNFTDGTCLKITSDPEMCFDGLAFYSVTYKTVFKEVKEETIQEIV